MLHPAWTIRTPPLGLSYISATLRRAGYEVFVKDCNIEFYKFMKDFGIDLWHGKNYYLWYGKDFERVVLPHLDRYFDQILPEILSASFDAIGLSVYDTSISSSIYFATKIKPLLPQIKIFVGGPAITKEMAADFVNKGFIDAAVVGEGEIPVVALLDAFKENRVPSQVPQVVCRGEDGSVVINEMPRQFARLDEIPMPDFSDYNLSDYQMRQVPIMMSRGCVARCAFCGESVYWLKFRTRSAEGIVEEIERDISEYKVDWLAFNDSLINGDHQLLDRVCNLIIERELKFIWGGYARIDKALTPELLKKMRKAGVVYLSFGLESGSQKVLDLMNKRFTIEEAERVIRDTHNAGIDVHLNIIIGFPNEDSVDFYKTLDFIYRNREYIKVVNTGDTCAIIPGTIMARFPERFNIKYESPLDWYTLDNKNTLEIRRSRLEFLKRFLSDMNIEWY